MKKKRGGQKKKVSEKGKAVSFYAGPIALEILKRKEDKSQFINRCIQAGTALCALFIVGCGEGPGVERQMDRCGGNALLGKWSTLDSANHPTDDDRLDFKPDCEATSTRCESTFNYEFSSIDVHTSNGAAGCPNVGKVFCRSVVNVNLLSVDCGKGTFIYGKDAYFRRGE